MNYPEVPNFSELCERICLYAQLKHEYGAGNLSPILRKAEMALEEVIEALIKIPVDENLAEKEPNTFDKIQKLRPEGPRRLWPNLEKRDYQERLEGALLGVLECPLLVGVLGVVADHRDFGRAEYPLVEGSLFLAIFWTQFQITPNTSMVVLPYKLSGPSRWGNIDKR